VDLQELLRAVVTARPRRMIVDIDVLTPEAQAAAIAQDIVATLPNGDRVVSIPVFPAVRYALARKQNLPVG
jgi:hypothetical protein